MLKDIRDTFLISCCLLIILIIVLFTTTGFNTKDEITIYQELSIYDEPVKDATAIIDDNELIRKAYYSNSIIENDEIIKMILQKINKNEVKEYTIIPEKIVCKINETVKFISSNNCNIIEITNEQIMEYQLKLFNTSKSLIYNNINYKGLNCINNNQKYYCLVSDYQNNYYEQSYIEKTYLDSDKIVIMEYYNKTEDKKTLNETEIINNGVLYKHTFNKNEHGYYLEESKIVN